MVLLVSVLGAAAIFLLDLKLPLGVAVGVLYVPVVALSSVFVRGRPLLVLAVLTTALTVVGWAFSPPGGVPWMGAANRLASVAAIWSVALCAILRHHGVARPAESGGLHAREQGASTPPDVGSDAPSLRVS